MRILIFLLGGLVVLTSGAPTRAIDGRIVQVGYSMSETADPLIGQTAGAQKFRQLDWVPILVHLEADPSGALFRGTLLATQRDLDGDIVVSELPVTVRGPRDFWVYVSPASTRQEVPFAVKLVDEDGGSVTIHNSYTGAPVDRLVPPSPPLVVSSDTMVVLDISARRVQPLYRVATYSTEDKNAAGFLLDRPLAIGGHLAHDLPSSPLGLDMVDVVIWDGADPSQMVDAAQQLPALIEWVRQGGVLVLGVGRTWQTVERSALGRLLPGPLSETKTIESREDAQRLARRLFDADDDESAAGAPMQPLTACPLARATLRAGARILYPSTPPGPNVLVAERSVGRGRIIYVGAELQDLYRAIGSKRLGDDLTMTLVGARRTIPTADDSSSSPYGYGTGYSERDESLADAAASAVSFSVQTGLYMLFAILFVIGYILVASVGSWQWLVRRGWQKHSWTVFALLAGVGSLFSLGAVRVIRGVGYDVQELSVVDMRAGEFDAQATSLFGLKTAAHDRLDLALPPDWTKVDPSVETPCSLRALPQSPNEAESTYLVADTYRMLPTLARLEDVPTRATLKPLIGHWTGPLGGRIQASLTCRDEGGRDVLDENSWLKNELGVDLHRCMLIQALTDPGPGPPTHRSGPSAIVAFQVGEAGTNGTIRNGQRIGNLRSMAFAPGASVRDMTPLADFQRTWARRFRVATATYGSGKTQPVDTSRDTVEAALLLLTTFRELEEQRGSAIRLTPSYLSELDLSDQLTKDVMLFIGFSDEPGPGRLCYRATGSSRAFRAIQPATSLTMYRVLIPVERAP